ncbi:hypothetical protein ACMSEZ_07855 [Bacteroides thetaiotaomicron]
MKEWSMRLFRYKQAEAYRKPTQKAVKDAVKELNPDTNSLGSRG